MVVPLPIQQTSPDKSALPTPRNPCIRGWMRAMWQGLFNNAYRLRKEIFFNSMKLL
jgi:hypothetical protein